MTAAEVEIVLQAYQIFGASGWEEVLDNIKEQVSGQMAGNWLQNEKIKEYYKPGKLKEVDPETHSKDCKPKPLQISPSNDRKQQVPKNVHNYLGK